LVREAVIARAAVIKGKTLPPSAGKRQRRLVLAKAPQWASRQCARDPPVDFRRGNLSALQRKGKFIRNRKR
jgi:hypothetical protein